MTVTDMHVCQDGPREAPALLLVHGTAASLRTWDALVPLLTGNHHVIRVDLLGCGESAKPDDGSYAIPDQARRVGKALDRLGVEHVTVAGHSSGGTVATALAEQRPDLVTAVALVNTGPAMSAFIGADMATGPVEWSDLSDEQVRQLLSPAFAEGFEVPQAFLDEFRCVDLEVFARISQAVRAYLDERPLPERLAPLGKPLLVLLGAEDRRWRPAATADYHAVPGATVELLPGVGHTPILEDPPRVAEALLAFAATHATLTG